ncbi:MAG: SGNH/GDSL hydrolase family protein [Candidatus Nanopelagicales bacterium]|jgi:lysophospholipase L1-like esterase
MWSRYVALGDSFTEGLMDETGPDGRHRGWADRLACQLQTVNPDLLYANLAIRGRLLGQVVDEQVPQALALNPDLVSIAAGVNDTLRRSYDLHSAMTSLENAVIAFRGSGADVLLVAFGDPSRRSRVMSSVSGRIAAANAATLAIAQHYGCRVVEFWGCAAFDDDSFWDEDRLHLSSSGHALAARAAADALGIGDDTWRTPQPLTDAGGPLHRGAGHVRWARQHFAPWLARRLRGQSSGDMITPKRPALERPACP